MRESTHCPRQRSCEIGVVPSGSAARQRILRDLPARGTSHQGISHQVAITPPRLPPPPRAGYYTILDLNRW